MVSWEEAAVCVDVFANGLGRAGACGGLCVDDSSGVLDRWDSAGADGNDDGEILDTVGRNGAGAVGVDDRAVAVEGMPTDDGVVCSGYDERPTSRLTGFEIGIAAGGELVIYWDICFNVSFGLWCQIGYLIPQSEVTRDFLLAVERLSLFVRVLC